MAIMTASEPVVGDLDHDADIEECRQRREEDEYDQVAPPPVRVEGRHG
jgi:hypothetical protein